MIARIDHIAIAVRDYEKARHFFEDILGAIPGMHAEDQDKRFYWRTFVLGDLSRLELLAPTSAGSFLDGFLSKRDGGFHHITLQTPDLEAAIAHLEKSGIPYFGKHTYPDGSWKEIFIHPKDAFGALVQIAEFRQEDWASDDMKMPPGQRWQIEKRDKGCHIVFAHPGSGKVSIEFSREEAAAFVQELQATINA
ncbi:MAG TPA: VOC family protein [Candidatus Hydrogenedentes bacterium]|nr:VOC family protein [Candidatus Hydrogenedentota bacterium]